MSENINQVIENWNINNPNQKWDPRLLVGPYTLEKPFLGEGVSKQEVVDQLLGVGNDLETFESLATQRLIPHRISSESIYRKIILTSASSQINARQIEFDAFNDQDRQRAIGIDPAIISREAFMADEDDIVVGRGSSWRDVVDCRSDIISIDIGHEEIYQLANENEVGLIACVPPGWGQIYCGDENPIYSTRKVLSFKYKLKDLGLIY